MQEVESGTNMYHDLVMAGYATKRITLEVGSRGMVDVADFADLQEAVHAPEKDYIALCQQTIRAVILGSYSIWGSRLNNYNCEPR